MTAPMSRRDVWLTVALDVAKGNIPAPYTLTVRDDIHVVSLHYREDTGQHRTDAIRTAGHYRLPFDHTGATGTGIHHGMWRGPRDGWSWYVGAQLNSPLDAEPLPPLAEQVVAAIGAGT